MYCDASVISDVIFVEGETRIALLHYCIIAFTAMLWFSVKNNLDNRNQKWALGHENEEQTKRAKR